MDESAHFGILSLADITSDAVLRSCLDEISRRLETRLRGKRSIFRFLNYRFVWRSEEDCVILSKLTEAFGSVLSLEAGFMPVKDQVIGESKFTWEVITCHYLSATPALHL